MRAGLAVSARIVDETIQLRGNVVSMLPGQAGNMLLAPRYGAMTDCTGWNSPGSEARDMDILPRLPERDVMQQAGRQGLIAKIPGKFEDLQIRDVLQLSPHHRATTDAALEVPDLFHEVIEILARQLGECRVRALPLGAMADAALSLDNFAGGGSRKLDRAGRGLA